MIGATSEVYGMAANIISRNAPKHMYLVGQTNAVYLRRRGAIYM